MSREDYVELVQDLCEELELGDAGEFLDRGLLQVDETLVAIEYLEERDEIRLLADLGEIEEGVDRSGVVRIFVFEAVGDLLSTDFSSVFRPLPGRRRRPG